MSDKCGTYAGWNAHRRASEKPCDACKEAQRLYIRAWRAKKGAAVIEEQIRNAARQRALWRLKDMHRAHFDLLVADEIRVEKAIRARQKRSA